MAEQAMSVSERKRRIELVSARVIETMKLDPKVEILLGQGGENKPYTLVFDNRAAKDVLEDTGLNLLTAELTDEEFNNPKILGSVLHRGLQRKHPDLTADKVDELFTVRHVFYIKTQIINALSLFIPDLEDIPGSAEEKVPEPEPETDPT